MTTLGWPERLARAVARTARAGAHPIVVGLCGPQGSGKSTGAARVAALLAEERLRAAVLSLDDLYLPRGARAALGRRVHPLFATRGVPGTHDVALGLATLTALRDGAAVALPRFDQRTDEPRPAEEWPRWEGGADIVLFEGWCVGARPQDAAALLAPVNELEAAEDPAGIWRRHVNAALAGDYQRLFAAVDLLVLLRAPSFAVVHAWRAEAERNVRAMDEAALCRFVQYFERLTRHVDAEMPARADLVFALDADRRLLL